MAVTADDAEGYTIGERIADDLMARPFRLDDAKRPLYHAAAVFASNYLIVTGAIAEELFRRAGVPDPLAAMLPLQRASLDNVERLGAGAALTGPAVRGDAGTIERNLEALRASAPDAVGAYVELCRVALDARVERRSPAGRAPRRGRRGARAMELIRAAADLTAAVEERRSAGADVGLVPTMGALHDGHASLIRRARSERDVVVVSIFVNPKQFGPGEDLSRYPARRGSATSTWPDPWAPTWSGRRRVDEFYPPGVELAAPDPGPIGDVLEGAARPGHFAGVLTAVHRLFDVVGASAAYFGEKDAQQLFLVRRMVEQLGLPNTIVACPTVREPDGLALSSRNAYLSPEEREQAGCLFLALSEAAELARRRGARPGGARRGDGARGGRDAARVARLRRRRRRGDVRAARPGRRSRSRADRRPVPVGPPDRQPPAPGGWVGCRSMLLAADVGNTEIVLGVFQGDELVHTWRISTQAGAHGRRARACCSPASWRNADIAFESQVTGPGRRVRRARRDRGDARDGRRATSPSRR